MSSPNRRQFRTYLESLRSPVAAMAGLPVEAVSVYAQQSLEEYVNNAIAGHSCAVLLGIPGWAPAKNSITRVKGPPLVTLLEVRVWTPETVLNDEAPTTLDVAEDITRGLHARVPPEGSPGRARIPEFKSGRLVVEQIRETRWLVANLLFEFPIALLA